MATKIVMEKTGNLEFLVRISENDSESTHRVTIKQRDIARLASGKVTPEELVRRSFQFLLEREPKESILSRFDLSVISRYFPEFEEEIRKAFSSRQGLSGDSITFLAQLRCAVSKCFAIAMALPSGNLTN